MEFTDPIKKTKSEYKEIVEKISVQNSPVGIDAQYTHAIIITFLQQISTRLERLEALMLSRQPKS